MVENQSVIDRLKLFIKSKNLGQTKFEEMCNLGRGWISKIKGTPKDDKLLNILQQFPDLNKTWLLTGEGSMLRAETTASLSLGAENEEIRKLKERIKELEEQNAELREDKKYLKELLNSRGLSNCG